VLAQEHPTELLEPGRRIFERPDDRLALWDVEAEHLHFAGVGGLEPLGERVVFDEAGKLEDQLVTDRDTGEDTRSTLPLVAARRFAKRLGRNCPA